MPASRRVSPSQLFRAHPDGLFASGRELGQILEEVAGLGVALLFQTAFEAEVTEFLGRERYARGERSEEGLRNGYSPIGVADALPVLDREDRRSGHLSRPPTRRFEPTHLNS